MRPLPNLLPHQNLPFYISNRMSLISQVLGSCSTSSGETYDKSLEQRQQLQAYEQYNATSGRILKVASSKSLTNFTSGEHSCDRGSQADLQMTELPLQEFNSSPPPAKRPEGSSHSFPPDVTTTNRHQPPTEDKTSPAIPEPPPPPRGHFYCGAYNQPGILRPHGAPTTPGTMKKRVQIQEISV